MCGTEFESARKKRFCSVVCRNKNNAAHQEKNGHVIVCPICGESFYVSPTYTKRNRQFCSNKCRSVAMLSDDPNSYRARMQRRHDAHVVAKLNKPKFYCKTCGQEMMQSNASRRKYCSLKCRSDGNKGKNNAMWKGGKIERKCEMCGVLFLVVPAVVRNGQGRFCCRRCFGEWCKENVTGENNPHWSGGSSKYYGKNWHVQRAAARKRDGHKCMRCGMTKRQLGREMDVHHIKRFRLCADYIEANQLHNLVSLCPSCHTTVEKNGVDF